VLSRVSFSHTSDLKMSDNDSDATPCEPVRKIECISTLGGSNVNVYAGECIDGEREEKYKKMCIA